MKDFDIPKFLEGEYNTIVGNRIISLDIETHDPHLIKRGESWIFNEGEILVCSVFDGKRVKTYSGKTLHQVKQFLIDNRYTIIGANIKYDVCWLAYELKLKDTEIKARLLDIQITETMIDEHQKVALEALAKKYLNEQKGGEVLKKLALEKGFTGDFRKYLKWFWDNGYKKEVIDYVKSDADQPYRIWEHQKKIIEEFSFTRAVAMNCLELEATVGMKIRGTRIDMPQWEKNCKLCADTFNTLFEEFTHLYGSVNINSSQQVAQLLQNNDIFVPYKLTIKGFKQPAGVKFENLKHSFTGNEVWQQAQKLRNIYTGIAMVKGKIILVTPQKYTERLYRNIIDRGYEVVKNPVVDQTVLKTLKHYDIVDRLLTMKQIKSVQNKFLGEKFRRFITQDAKGDYRIHGNFNVTGASQTGRLSSSKPNLQNIPSKTVVFKGTVKEINLASLCRQVFIPERGEAFVRFDFSGQENVLQAHFGVGLAGEQARQRYIDNPLFDEHTYAVEITGLAEEHEPKLARKYAKNFRFGVSYGMQIRGMMTNFGWGKEQAEDIKMRMSLAIPHVLQTIEAVQHCVLHKRPYIKTLIGRRIRMRKGHSKEAYKFYNYLIQGSASDMTKIATGRTEKTKTNEKMLLTVHDENCFSVPMNKAGLQRVMQINAIMQDFGSLMKVPIRANVEIGTNWSDLEEFDVHGTEKLSQFITRKFKECKSA